MSDAYISKVLQDEGTERVELCTGRVKDGRDFYAFLQMDMESYGRYRKALSRNEPIDLNAYGRILHTGWGKAPDEATSAWVLKTYTENSKIIEAIGQDALAMANILKRNSEDQTCDDR